MRLISLTGATHVEHPVHGPADAGPDGVFDVDEPFATDLLAHRGQWGTEADQVAEQARAALDELRDPRKAAEVLAALRDQVTTLEPVDADAVTGRLADLEAAFEAVKGRVEDEVGKLATDMAGFKQHVETELEQILAELRRLGGDDDAAKKTPAKKAAAKAAAKAAG